MSDEDQEQWRNRWTPKGLPAQLLQDMIDEANAEYESELQYSPYNRYGILDVLVADVDLNEGEFYLYYVQRADEIFRGRATTFYHFLFQQIPTIEVVVQVLKMHYSIADGLSVRGFGYLVFNHTKDESVEVFISTFFEGEWILFTYIVRIFAEQYSPTGEDSAIGDSGLSDESISRVETVVITNT